ncbi:helix-turn-helix transcriptional regulator [Desulfovibrio sp. UCD-KL4C]|uniref:helix-turn-helix domain-containing protein n=1 Tax=Desulfovibrio sp. UCD-KL4C TaxID=2578120 RepID=UPI0025C20EE7|nr:helix-turn-helix transcriptional regulator [Desulfovibrio sp. UCD-KL4C]
MKKKFPEGSNSGSNLKKITANSEELETLGDRIRFIWILSGLKREALAEKLNVTSATLTNYVGNKRLPNSDFLIRICSEFEVSPAWLLLFKEPMFLAYNPDYPELSPPPENPESDTKNEGLEEELLSERGLSRELLIENRELLKENGDLRVELERMKARSASDQDKPNEAHRNVG